MNKQQRDDKTKEEANRHTAYRIHDIPQVCDDWIFKAYLAGTNSLANLEWIVRRSFELVADWDSIPEILTELAKELEIEK